MRTEFYTFLDDERITVRFEFCGTLAFLHVAIHRSFSGMRAARAYFSDAMKVLKSLGYRFAHVLIPQGDAMLLRFEKLFGFCEIERVKGHILMARET